MSSLYESYHKNIYYNFKIFFETIQSFENRYENSSWKNILSFIIFFFFFLGTIEHIKKFSYAHWYYEIKAIIIVLARFRYTRGCVLRSSGFPLGQFAVSYYHNGTCFLFSWTLIYLTNYNTINTVNMNVTAG